MNELESLNTKVPWPEGEYQIIVADPPWPYYGDPNKMAAAGKHYSLMTMDEIVALPLPVTLANPGLLFLWVTSSTLEMGLDLFRKWGLVYRGVAFVWVKTRQDGQVIGAQGVRPSITKPTTEMVVVGSQVKKGRPLKLMDEGIAQVVLAPRGAHSQKPTEVQERIERMYPSATKLELFARNHREGWARWGDQA